MEELISELSGLNAGKVNYNNNIYIIYTYYKCN